MAPQFVFATEGLTKRYSDKAIFENISLSFFYGAKIGIVGDNGAGKSTLLKIMAGLDTEFDGTAELGKNMRIGYVPQEPQLDPNKTVRENLEEAFADTKAMIDRYNEITASMGGELSDDEMDKAMADMEKLQEKIDAVDGWELDHALEVASDAMVLPPDDADVTKLSGGERRRVALCKAFLEKPDMLLLDEPTNHLDGETIDWMEKFLHDYPGTVIIVTHDRYFLDNITKWILELDGGRGVPFEGNYTDWITQKIRMLAVKEKSESSRQRAFNHELKWLKMTNENRQEMSRSRILDYENMIRGKSEGRNDASEILIAPGPPLGEHVLRVNNLSKGFDDRKLIENLSFDIPRGAIIGILGPNGVGKTTLFQMIQGTLEPDSGSLELGPTVALSAVDQHRDHLDGEKTIFDEIAQGMDEFKIGDRSIPARAYVSRFNFKSTDQNKLVKNLSGGERNRVHLAKLLRSSGNFLLLDEPTNDLDVGTLQTLENAILQYAGSILLISHDRFFLDRVCTHMLVYEGDAKVRWFEGNFRAYEEKRSEELKGKSHKRRGAYRKLK